VTRRQWLAEAAIIAAVFVASGWWGTRYWNLSWNAGREPIFYQEYFEPAAMMACGKGLVISHPQLPALTEFLVRRIDRFSCDRIPPDTVLNTQDMYQGVWRYLMIAVATTWRLRGISWSGMAPLFGLLFAGSVTSVYGIFRLGMGPILALGGAFAVSISTLHLLNLPHLRDYAKAPFTLLLILTLGILVKVRPTRRALLGCAAAYGLVLGVGYGFRPDFLINIPVFFIVLFLFVDGGISNHLALKATAAAVCLSVFLVSAWPIVSVVYRSGGCQWHMALLGLSTSFTEALDVENAPYDWGNAYADGFISKTATSYGRRVHPGIDQIRYCSHDYDVVTGEYLMEIVRRFPADMVTRAYASMVQISRLPFVWSRAPLPEVAPWLYEKRFGLLTRLKSSGLFWIGATLILTSAVSLRLALFLGFFLLYFGGYPAIQFANRHYFHLEIITWWALGFTLQQAWGAISARRSLTDRVDPESKPNWRQAAWALPAMLALAAAPLFALRAYQQATLRGFFAKYMNSPVDAWPLEAAPPGQTHGLPPSLPDDEATGEQFVVVTVNAWRCADRPSVTFRYDKAFPFDDFTRTFTLAQRSPRQQPTKIFTPVYRHFVGVEFSDVHPGCIGGISRVRDVKNLTLLLPSVLPPDWERQPLRQRLKAWPFLGGY
jgi:hypothetical protein